MILLLLAAQVGGLACDRIEATISCKAKAPVGDTTIVDIGPCDGKTDLSERINLALQTLPPNGGKLHFQAGKCLIASSIEFAYPHSQPFSLTIEGDGQDVTRLYTPTQGIDLLSLSMANYRHSFHVSKLSFSCGVSRCGAALIVNQSQQEGPFAQNDLREVTFAGEDGGQKDDYWTFGFVEHGVSGINIEGCQFYGDRGNMHHTAVSIGGVNSGANKYSLAVNIANTSFFNNLVGVSLGSFWQGVQISNSNFVNGTNAILQVPNAQGVLSELSISNSNLNTYGNLVLLLSGVDQVALSNDLLYIDRNTTGLNCTTRCLGVSVVGNNFTYAEARQQGNVGIHIDDTANQQPSVITGNTFQGLAAAISLGHLARFVTAATNSYSGNTYNVISTGGSACPASGYGNCVGRDTP